MTYKCGRPDCEGCKPTPAPPVADHTCNPNTYPDCCYPDTPPVPLSECTIPECPLPTDRTGQPCDPCMEELGVGA